jgi:imidazolonepropionase-like amidohydrolase
MNFGCRCPHAPYVPRGVLAPGKLADVVVFNGDPSRNIALMEAKPALVMVGGEKVDLARLPS